MPSGQSIFIMTAVSEITADEFPFLADLPKREDWSDELKAEMDAYIADFEEHEGLLLQKFCPTLLGVSKQRFSQLKVTYGFKEFVHFETTFYSRKQLQAFYQTQRDESSHQDGTSAAIKAQFAT